MYPFAEQKVTFGFAVCFLVECVEEIMGMLFGFSGVIFP